MRLEQLLGLDKLTISQCQEIAKKSGNFDTMEFYLCGPARKLKAKWLDAYAGFFQLEGQENFIMVKTILFANDLWCETIDTDEQGAA